MANTNLYLDFVADAGGTVDVITATYSPAVPSLYDGLLLFFFASGANTSTTPSFSPNGLTARTIVKQGGTALAAGDIPAANALICVAYDLGNTRWELLNPAVSSGTGVLIADAGGTGDAITATFTPAIGAFADKLIVWVVTTSANTITNPTFDANGLGARFIVKNGATALLANDILGNGHVICLVYDSGNDWWNLLNPANFYTQPEIAALLLTKIDVTITPRVVTAAGAVTITTTDLHKVVVVNKTVGAATTVNLPASPTAGHTYIIKDGKGDAVSNNITIDPDGATTIDGGATYVLNENYGSITVVYNGTEWNII